MSMDIIQIDIEDEGSQSGATVQEAQHAFPWYGATIKVNPGASEIVYIDFIAKAGQYDQNDPRAGVAVKEFIEEIIHPEDFEVFWDLAKTHRRTIEDLSEISMKIVAAVTGDPTSGQSASSGGPSRTVANSTDARYNSVITEYERKGRPDIAVIYDDARLNGAMG